MDPKISFISDKNLKRVYTAISNSVKENYNYNINNEFFIEMKGMMEFILQNVPKYNPQKQTQRQYLKFLNTKLLEEFMPFVNNNVEEAIKEKDNENTFQYPQDTRKVSYKEQQLQQQDFPRQENTRQYSRNNIDNQLQNLEQERNNPQLIQEQNYSDMLPQTEENLDLQNMSGGFMQTIPEENNQDPSILMEQMQQQRQLIDQEYSSQPTTGIIPNARPPPEMRNEVVSLNSNQTPEFLQQSIDPNIIQNNYSEPNPQELYQQENTIKEVIDEKNNNELKWNEPILNKNVEPDTTFQIHYLTIDSRDRDRTSYPDPNSYVVHLGSVDNDSGAHTQTNYKNLVKIELLHCIIPNRNNIKDEIYILLEIDELGGVYNATNNNTRNSFAKLHSHSMSASDTFFDAVSPGDYFISKNYEPTPLSNLSKLTIKFKKYDGTLFNFGSDSTPPTDPTIEIQNTLTFKITTMVTKNTDKINII